MRQSIVLKEQRMGLVAQSRAILDKSKTEKRASTPDEITAYDKMDADIENLSKEILMHEKQEAREAEATVREDRKTDLGEDSKAKAEVSANGLITMTAKRNPVTNRFERKYTAVSQGVRSTPEFAKAFSNFLMGGNEHRFSPEIKNALQAESDTTGGFTVAPQQFVADLIQAVDDQLFIRQLATVTPVAKAASIGRPSLDNDPADSDWTSELATGGEDSTMSFGKRELHPHPLAKLIKVSNKLLRSSALPVEALIMERLSYKFAVTQEKVFLTGNGSNQPLGLFTASADGVPTSRDVSTGNSTTAIGADGLIEALYSLKSQYQRTASWLFHRTAVKNIRKLKDGDGQYLWKPGLGEGQPDMILGRPFYMSEYVPSTFTTGLYVGMIADFSKYWIADALDMQFQRLAELYAATNQVGFIGRLETDAMPILSEAFARVTLA